MPIDDRPTITIELGLRAAAKPSLHLLRRRARNRAEVVSAGQPELAFLIQSDFPETAPLKVVDGAYVIEGPLPRVAQGRLAEGTRVSLAERDDPADEKMIEAVLEAVTLNSQLLAEVAAAMATSPNVVDDIWWLERHRGAQTAAMRRFVFEKQESFGVTVDGEVVNFQSQTARTAVRDGNTVQVLITPLQAKPEGRLIKARIDAAVGDGRNSGVQKGGTHEFRLGRLEPWQSALVEFALQTGHPIAASASEIVSTCSLQSLPTEVLEIHNWAALINLGLTELSRAANDLQRENGDAQEDRAA